MLNYIQEKIMLQQRYNLILGLLVTAAGSHDLYNPTYTYKSIIYPIHSNVDMVCQYTSGGGFAGSGRAADASLRRYQLTGQKWTTPNLEHKCQKSIRACQLND